MFSRGRRPLRRRALVIAALSTLALTFAELPGTDDAEVLGRIEVRGRQSDSLDGRSTGHTDAASGLTMAAVAETGAPRTGVVRDEPSARPDAEAAAALPASVEATSEVLSARAQEALALLAYPWEERLPGWTITFVDEQQGLRGLTFSAEQSIEIYVRPGDTTWDLARVTAHEIGHAVDLVHNSHDDREAWREARSLAADVPWWPTSGAADFATGAGDFAECFAAWQVGSASLSQVGGECDVDQLALLAALS